MHKHSNNNSGEYKKRKREITEKIDKQRTVQCLFVVGMRNVCNIKLNAAGREVIDMEMNKTENRQLLY